jgi:uncharacterized cupin superfamily protein
MSETTVPRECNIFEPRFDQLRATSGYVCRRARVGREIGGQRLGGSVWEIAPGQAACPYHFHFGDEEMLFVLDGRPTLRTPQGWRELEPGAAVCFQRGPGGAHQVMNHTRARVRVLIVSTAGDPDVCVYPDSDKVGVYARYDDEGGAEMELYFRRLEATDYYDREPASSAAASSSHDRARTARNLSSRLRRLVVVFSRRPAGRAGVLCAAPLPCRGVRRLGS